jgi:hypothetical protein
LGKYRKSFTYIVYQILKGYGKDDTHFCSVKKFFQNVLSKEIIKINSIKLSYKIVNRRNKKGVFINLKKYENRFSYTQKISIKFSSSKEVEDGVEKREGTVKAI